MLGKPVWTVVRRGNYAALASVATTWLAAFAGATRRVTGPHSSHELVDAIFAEFARRYGALVDSTLLARTDATLRTLPGLPLICEHRDFSPWNVLIAPDGQLAVLDWESADLCGLPALDLIYFLTLLALVNDGTMITCRLDRPHRINLQPDSYIEHIRSACLSRYARATGLSPASLGPLTLLAWLVHANAAHRQVEAAAARGLPADTFLIDLFLHFWKVELAISCGHST
jgi:hypothetical protein